MHTFLVNKDGCVLSSDSQSGIFFKLYLHSVGPRISLGLMVSSTSGKMWRVMRVDSRVCEGCKLFMWLVSFPRCVVTIM